MYNIFGRLSFLNSLYFLAMSIVLKLGPDAAAKNRSKNVQMLDYSYLDFSAGSFRR